MNILAHKNVAFLKIRNFYILDICLQLCKSFLTWANIYVHLLKICRLCPDSEKYQNCKFGGLYQSKKELSLLSPVTVMSGSLYLWFLTNYNIILPDFVSKLEHTREILIGQFSNLMCPEFVVEKWENRNPWKPELWSINDTHTCHLKLDRSFQFCRKNRASCLKSISENL